MATKAEEMKALNQIKKIVEGIGGDDSYVGRAFSGCFEMAQDNIENDFWNSMKDQRDIESKRCFEAEKKNSEKDETINRLQRDFEIVCDREKKAWERNAELLKEVKEGSNTAIENWNKFREQEDKVEALQMEIIKLKARLFDMMEAQGA